MDVIQVFSAFRSLRKAGQGGRVSKPPGIFTFIPGSYLAVHIYQKQTHNKQVIIKATQTYQKQTHNKKVLKFQPLRHAVDGWICVLTFEADLCKILLRLAPHPLFHSAQVGQVGLAHARFVSWATHQRFGPS